MTVIDNDPKRIQSLFNGEFTMDENTKKDQEDESQPNYVRILSHQLKSPINSIQSLLNTISEGFTGELPSKTRYFIEKAVNRTTEAKELITDLLNYEAYSQNQEVLHEEIEFVEGCRSLVNRYASRAAEQDISLHTRLPEHIKAYILGDWGGLGHALRNIIDNAIKYTPAHGSITITFTINETKEECRLKVADTGYGIPKEEQEHIFEPFYRSIQHKANIPGTGLGLAITKRVITNHHGTITFDSAENQGTTFTIRLPYIRIARGEEETAPHKKVVIIGGVTAGPKAAARLRRLDEDLDITIIDKSEFLLYPRCGLPSYISNSMASSRSLMSTADSASRDIDFFESIDNITIMNSTEALEIDRERKIVNAQNLKTKTALELPYDTLLLATGATPIIPKIPGIRQKGIYSLHSLEDADGIKQEFAPGEALDVCIVGGGLIGVSTAESLIIAGTRVTILERRPYILFDQMDKNIAIKIQRQLQQKGIKIITNVEITAIEKHKHHFTILTEEDSYHANLIILAAGVTPNTGLAEKAGLTIGESGGILVNNFLQTSDEHIYAVGDCAESVSLITQKHEYWPLGSVSIKMGRIAADNICGRGVEFHGSIGTAMFKIIDVNVARTGLTLRSAREQGYNAEAAIVAGLDRAHYYENARYIILKAIADKDTKRILGAQGYGKGNVVSKIQLFACAITQGLSLDEMFRLDMGYSPSFNTPIDIVQTACLVLNNKIEKLFNTVTVGDFEQEKADAGGVIDVSPFSEHVLNSIPESINIPLETLRIEGIPFEKDAKIILYSKTSSGAYKAYRYLASNGYANLRVLEGGYIGWEK